jgi:hypothetical protein
MQIELMSSRLLIYLYKGLMVSVSILLYVGNLIGLSFIIGFFILAEIISILCLLINIKNSLVKLKNRYVIFEGLTYIMFWIFVILALQNKIKFIIVLLPLFIRFVIKLKSYCKCDEYVGENDLEIFFKVSPG